MSFGIQDSNPAPARSQPGPTLCTGIRSVLVPALALICILATCILLAAAPPQSDDPRDEPPIARVPELQQRGKLISGRQPEYPKSVRKLGIEGTVKLDVRIDEDGRVIHIRVVSGHPMLSPLAVDAVKTWRFRPTYVNGKRAEVLSQFQIEFPPPPEDPDPERPRERQRKA